MVFFSQEVLFFVFCLFDMQKEEDGARSGEAELVLPTHLSLKHIQMYEKYPKGQSRGRHWKHLKQILQAKNYQSYLLDEPNCKFLECKEKKGTFYWHSFIFEKHNGLYILITWKNDGTALMGKLNCMHYARRCMTYYGVENNVTTCNC